MRLYINGLKKGTIKNYKLKDYIIFYVHFWGICMKINGI